MSRRFQFRMRDETTPAANGSQKNPPRRRLRASDLAMGAAVGSLLVLVGFLVLGVLIVVSRQHATPALTADSLEAARRRWQENGVPDYRMDIRVTGRQPSRYHVEVKGGKPQSVLRNDREIPRRNFSYWTVPGLFDVIEHDVECSADPTRGFGARRGSTAVLRAEFEPRYGYPRKFERLILGEPQLDMTWEITTFDDGAAAKRQ